jgi:hypothetical protein
MIRSLVATLLSGSFALQLLLAGVGSACVMPRGAAHAPASPAAEAQAGMAGMDMSGAPAADHATTQAQDHGDGVPCDQPGTSRMCQVMASCAGGFVVGESNEQRVAVVVPSAVESSIVTAPSSRTIAPELPPPRA